MAEARLEFTRQSDVVSAEDVAAVVPVIIGAGAIGSHTAESLAKIGIREMDVWDFDTVEAHNLPNQGYRLGDLGKLKVEALKERLEADTGVTVRAHAEKFTGEDLTHELVISAVDSMSARKTIWTSVKNSLHTQTFIDPRMASRYGIIYIVDMTNSEMVEAYEKTLYSDEEAHPAPCTDKATVFCAQGMSCLITAQLIELIRGETTKYCLEIDFANMHLWTQ